jgi:hypothetical protein
VDSLARRRRAIRHLAAAASAAAAGMYFLIGLRLVTVVELAPDEDPNTQMLFGIPAALAYTLGTILLLAFDRRLLWVLGAILQVLVIATYFGVADQRTPMFELWGILIRVAQLVLLAALAYLAIRPVARGRIETARAAHGGASP